MGEPMMRRLLVLAGVLASLFVPALAGYVGGEAAGEYFIPGPSD